VRAIGAVFDRHVSDQVLGEREAAIDARASRAGLERRARRPCALEHRDLAAVLDVGEVEVADEPDHFAGVVIDTTSAAL
jgi:hypothetical protein